MDERVGGRAGRGGTVEQQQAGYDDVMAELRARTPENDGRWTASQAASVYGETEQFEADAGVAEARERMQSPDETAAGQLQASADYMRGVVDADSTRNRYQQTTDFDRGADAAEQKAQIDASVAGQADQMQPGRDYAGQMTEAADVSDYGRLTGDATMADPDYQSAGLSPQQQQDLQGLREGEMGQMMERADVYDYGRLTGDATMADPDYQSAGLSPQQQQDLPGLREGEAQGQYQAFMDDQTAQEQRLEASRAGAEARMATPLDERESAGGAFGAPTYEDRAAQAAEQSDVHAYGRAAGDATMASPDYQSAGLSPAQQEQLDALDDSRQRLDDAVRGVNSFSPLAGTKERRERAPRVEQAYEELAQARTVHGEQRDELARFHQEGSDQDQ